MNVALSTRRPLSYCFLKSALSHAGCRCVSIFFVEFQSYFSRDYSATAWIHSLLDCTTMLCGKTHAKIKKNPPVFSLQKNSLTQKWQLKLYKTILILGELCFQKKSLLTGLQCIVHSKPRFILLLVRMFTETHFHIYVRALVISYGICFSPFFYLV